MVPDWVPRSALNYLSHIEAGRTIRGLARSEGVHASTMLRRIRRFEQRRDDPLVDEALASLGQAHFKFSDATGQTRAAKETLTMSRHFTPDRKICDEETVAREGRRILRRLSESGAVLAIAADMEKAAVVRSLADGRSTRTAVVDREVAQAFALKEWIALRKPGRVASYAITAAGRTALKRMLAETDCGAGGFAEAMTPFAMQHADMEARDAGEDRPRKIRYNRAESPVTALSRRREKDGKPFLSADLVAAAERLREDFEMAQMGPRVAQNWDNFLTAGTRGQFGGSSGPANGPAASRERVAQALRDLGPGLGDMVLRCCCFLEGLEAAEKRMGWSARSGKIVLRIALQRLKRHYEETYGPEAHMIG
ncbi:helix-turn-helix domain-containing protein [Oceanicola sp. D3]|nr:helix-turn-helix domain-containing protein [Oceanicola sp. D3]